MRFLVLHQGQIVTEQYVNGLRPDTPHLLMSVSKPTSVQVRSGNSPMVSSPDWVPDRMPVRSRSAVGSSRPGPSPRGMRAVGVGSRMCWNAHRLYSDRCLFCGVARLPVADGGGPLISRGLSR